MTYVKALLHERGADHVGIDWHGHRDRGFGVASSLAAGLSGFAAAVLLAALLSALKAARLAHASGIDLGGALQRVLWPAGVTDWIRLAARFPVRIKVEDPDDSFRIGASAVATVHGSFKSVR